MGIEQCNAFVNKSIEKLCQRHKELSMQAELSLMRSKRPQLISCVNPHQARREFDAALKFKFMNQRNKNGIITEVG